ncbi:CYTH and CHAD domain-containing protein [Psychromonas sp. RZ22]|uniref:CYTH and CHAD domain-containing protein n=1 Tax=Psychromonas algarum TaxID=2555643 RepID=UPI00106790E4|nr:CYTH and CHAD domain-containing protein [Psychromonas sp. RZ22]TEW53901.1 CYTH and CHAD domain-containing protein [Psychromonas sp. RZ22]
METEIEIKFFFNAHFADELLEEISQHTVISHKNQMLYNVYFETPSRALRAMDMGLRVRRIDEQCTQTIKTSGRVIGGLHQRPEYNEPIDGLQPELARFKSKIWPENTNVKELQEQLEPLFSTDFRRLHWLLEMQDGTLIEVAYDCGKIVANQAESEICEIELELVKGDEAQLFILAKDIAALPQVRLGNVSKAQRGYMLTEGAHFEAKSIDLSDLTAGMTLQQALSVNFQHGLKYLQYNENCYLESGDFSALVELQKSIMFLHQNIHLFKEAGISFVGCSWVEDLQWLARSFSWIDERLVFRNLLENKSYYIRKLPKLKHLQKRIRIADQALPNEEDIFNLLHNTRYCNFILGLTEWLIQLEKTVQVNEEVISLVTFSEGVLTEGWSKLIKLLSADALLSTEQLLPNQGLLISNLMTELSLGNVFDFEKCTKYCYPWLDIYQGMMELSMLDAIYELAADEDEGEIQAEYFKWVKRKQDSLLSAIEQSKQRAVMNEMYWLEPEN